MAMKNKTGGPVRPMQNPYGGGMQAAIPNEGNQVGPRPVRYGGPLPQPIYIRNSPARPFPGMPGAYPSGDPGYSDGQGNLGRGIDIGPNASPSGPNMGFGGPNVTPSQPQLDQLEYLRRMFGGNQGGSPFDFVSDMGDGHMGNMNGGGYQAPGFDVGEMDPNMGGGDMRPMPINPRMPFTGQPLDRSLPPNLRSWIDRQGRERNSLGVLNRNPQPGVGNQVPPDYNDLVGHLPQRPPIAYPRTQMPRQYQPMPRLFQPF